MSGGRDVHAWVLTDGRIVCADDDCPGRSETAIDLRGREFTTADLVEGVMRHGITYGRAEVVDQTFDVKTTFSGELTAEPFAPDSSWSTPAAVMLGAGVAIVGAVVGRVLGL